MIHEGTFTHPTQLVQKVRRRMTEYEEVAPNTMGHN